MKFIKPQNISQLNFIVGEAGSGKSVLLGHLLKIREPSTVINFGEKIPNSDIYLTKKENGDLIKFNQLDFIFNSSMDVIIELLRSHDESDTHSDKLEFSKIEEKLRSLHVLTCNECGLIDIEFIREILKYIIENTISEEKYHHNTIDYLMSLIHCYDKFDKNNEIDIYNKKSNSVVFNTYFYDYISLPHYINNYLDSILNTLKNRNENNKDDYHIITFDSLSNSLLHDDVIEKIFKLIEYKVNVFITFEKIGDTVNFINYHKKHNIKSSISLDVLTQNKTLLKSEKCIDVINKLSFISSKNKDKYINDISKEVTEVTDLNKNKNGNINIFNITLNYIDPNDLRNIKFNESLLPYNSTHLFITRQIPIEDIEFFDVYFKSLHC